MSKKSKKDPFTNGFTIDKDFYATYWTPEGERKIQEEREKDLQEECEREKGSSGSAGS